jgi:hypothetical protein
VRPAWPRARQGGKALQHMANLGTGETVVAMAACFSGSISRRPRLQDAARSLRDAGFCAAHLR